MGLKHFILDAMPKKLISYLPPDLRAKVKRRFLSWAQDNQSPVIEVAAPEESLPPLLASDTSEVAAPEESLPALLVQDISEEKTALISQENQIAEINNEEQPASKGDTEDLDPFLNTLGFPIYEPIRTRYQHRDEVSIDIPREFQLPEIRFEDRQGDVLISICTMNYLHMARTMIGSVREHHNSEEMTVYLLIVDWDGQELIELPNVTLLPGRAIGIDRFDYMALKYNAIELCCACKPHLIRYVMTTTQYEKIIYIDTDILIFSRLDDMLACLDSARLVVIPHILTHPPNRDGIEVLPSLKEIIYAGTYNAGMFGITVVPENAHFADHWSELLTIPGAFLSRIDFQHAEQEQQVFNWLINLADGVKVLKDTAYNVAYWNLHDRSLRYTGWDEPDQEPAWRVDGRPLVAFHFSGFSLSQPRRLSRYDFRYELYFLPSVTKLIEFYIDKLFENGALAVEERGYHYDKFPSGLVINPEIRLIFKKHENFLWRDLDPWSEAGERYYAQCLFLPLPQTSSLLPVALHHVYQRRNELRVAFPKADTEPEPMLNWFSHFGLIQEPLLYEYFNLYRPVVPKLAGIQAVSNIVHEYPAQLGGLARPMSEDRTRLINKLRTMGLETAANGIQSVAFEYFALSPIYLLWKFVKQQTQLQHTFPDLLFNDAPAFSEWLKENASSYFLEPALADIFLQKAQGRSLARIFSFLNDSWELVSQWPLALVGQNKEACIRALLAQLQHDRQFDLDDIVMYIWIMEVKPWAGLPLTFELLVNACRQPSPLLPEGQDALLGPLLTEPGFQNALDAYRAQTNQKKMDTRYASSQQKIGVMNGWPHIRSGQKDNNGINFFGYFKSPIGLGSLSKGLALALRSAEVQVQENVVNNASMEQDLQPDDFIRTYDYSLHTNLFLSYPHLTHRLLTTYPDHMVKNRRNIIYLAWEQRDGYPSWEHDYAEFDQVWALSHFAAKSFRKYMKRDDVITIPGVVDFESFPVAATKEEMGLDPDRFIFLYLFDASSSIERKNPEAAIRAFGKAFSMNEKVQLFLKVTNAHRLDCRQRLQHLTNLAARSGMDIHFLMSNLPRPEVLKTISAVDCYVSLHRAEGFGYTCAEAMAYAKPVIATNYSGTTDFMDTKSAFLVDYKECEVMTADGPFQRGSVWAEPSIEHAAAQMRQVYLNQKAAQKIGKAGQAKVRQLLSAERVGQIAAAALAGKLKDGVVLR